MYVHTHRHSTVGRSKHIMTNWVKVTHSGTLILGVCTVLAQADQLMRVLILAPAQATHLAASLPDEGPEQGWEDTEEEDHDAVERLEV